MADALIAHGTNRGIGSVIGGGQAALSAMPPWGRWRARLGWGRGIGAYLARLRTNAAARRAMKAALAATSTGLPATAEMYRGAPWASQAARQAIYARGAAGEGGD